MGSDSPNGSWGFPIGTDLPEPVASKPDRPPPIRLADLHPKRFFLDTWRQQDEIAWHERAEHSPSFDYRPLVALGLAAVCLTLMEYFGSGYQLGDALRSFDPSQGKHDSWSWQLRRWRFYNLLEYGYWSGCRVLGYFVLPALVVRWVFRQRLRDYGLNLHGLAEHAWLYALFYLVVLALVVLVSSREDFASYYPFYKQARRSWLDLATWELIYGLQFLALEFFFRGFLLFSCRRALGSHAIFAMTVPYCMIHFGKPWLEALAAIVAGIVLGTLALRTRSISNGFFIHVSVAISMDAASLLRGQGLPQQWWPT